MKHLLCCVIFYVCFRCKNNNIYSYYKIFLSFYIKTTQCFFLLEKKEEFLLTTDMRDYTDNSVLLCRGDIEMVKKICLICGICGCFTLKKRIFTQLVNSSPITLQVIVTLLVTAVIHFKALVTHSSPKTLYLVEYVENIRANHSSPLINVLRVTSDLSM